MQNFNTNFQCSICTKNNGKYLFTKHGYDIYKCKSCLHVQVNNLPDLKTLSEYYEKYFGCSTLIESADIRKIAFSSDGEIPLEIALKIGLNKDALVLDYGCSFGYDLTAFKNIGKFTHSYGIEVSDTARKTGTNILGHTIYESISDFRKHKNIADFVYLKHNLEHHLDPMNSLAEIFTIMNPRAKILIGIPNIHSWNSILGKNWEWLTPPVHLHYFSKQSIMTALERNGFDVIKLWSRRGHGQPFLRHLLYFTPYIRTIMAKIFGSPYDGYNTFNLFRKFAELLIRVLTFPIDTLTSFLNQFFLRGEEIWVLAEKKHKDSTISH